MSGPADGRGPQAGPAGADVEPFDGPRAARIQQRFERLLEWSRLLALIPVVFLLLDAAGSFVYGADILVRTADGDIGVPARIGGRLGIFLVVADTFLVGATLMIAAFGFYELFVIRKERARHKYWLPNWLRMRDLEDLKARVVSMLILVAAITFVDIAVESRDERGILFLGLGIAVVIIALTAFLRFGRRPETTSEPAPAPGTHSPSATKPDPPGDRGLPRSTRVPAASCLSKSCYCSCRGNYCRGSRSARRSTGILTPLSPSWQNLHSFPLCRGRPNSFVAFGQARTRVPVSIGQRGRPQGLQRSNAAAGGWLENSNHRCRRADAGLECGERATASPSNLAGRQGGSAPVSATTCHYVTSATWPRSIYRPTAQRCPPDQVPMTAG